MSDAVERVLFAVAALTIIILFAALPALPPLWQPGGVTGSNCGCGWGGCGCLEMTLVPYTPPAPMFTPWSGVTVIPTGAPPIAVPTVTVLPAPATPAPQPTSAIPTPETPPPTEPVPPETPFPTLPPYTPPPFATQEGLLWTMP